MLGASSSAVSESHEALTERSSVGCALAARAAWRRLGATVRMARHAARLTIADVADRANLACSLVSEIETGTLGAGDSEVRELAGPSDAELFAVGRALDVDAWQWIAIAREIRGGKFVGGEVGTDAP